MIEDKLLRRVAKDLGAGELETKGILDVLKIEESDLKEDYDQHLKSIIAFYKQTYTKPYLAVTDIIDELIEQGLTVEDRQQATGFLTRVGFYHFKGYALAFKTKDSRGDLTSHFNPTKSFNDIENLYHWDSQLRSLIFEQIELFEVSFKAAMVRVLGGYGFAGKGYGDPNRVQEILANTSENMIQDHLEWVKGRQNKIRDENYIVRHSSYFSKQSESIDQTMPIWMFIECLTVGECSKLYKRLSLELKQEIIDLFAPKSQDAFVSPKQFENMLLPIVTLRNEVAHLGKIWNRKFGMKGEREYLGDLLKDVPVNSDSMAAVVVVCYRLNSKAGHNGEWLRRFLAHICRFPEKQLLAEMGITREWLQADFQSKIDSNLME